MTRKDYVAAAEALNKARDEFRSEEDFRRAVSIHAKLFAADNERFDEHLFRNAVGVPETKVEVMVESVVAKRENQADPERVRQESWIGEVDLAEVGETEVSEDGIFRFFNRVTQADADRLERIGYDLPSMSVGDKFKLDDETYTVEPVGFSTD